MNKEFLIEIFIGMSVGMVITSLIMLVMFKYTYRHFFEDELAVLVEPERKRVDATEVIKPSSLDIMLENLEKYESKRK